jgi:hypothetical protein
VHLFNNASIAQLVERRSRKAQASGSIPLAGSNNIKDLQFFAVSHFWLQGSYGGVGADLFLL